MQLAILIVLILILVVLAPWFFYLIVAAIAAYGIYLVITACIVGIGAILGFCYLIYVSFRRAESTHIAISEHRKPCRNCSVEIESDDTYCLHCGSTQ